MVFTIHNPQLRRTILAGITYFAVVFSIGFILGTIRILLIVPRLGERAAELIENPVMLIFIVLTARWVVSRFELARPVVHKLVAGVFALTLMLFMEFEVVLRIRELSLTQYFALRDPVSAAVYYFMLGLFAMMPVVFEVRERH
jgi:hypothetical protein